MLDSYRDLIDELLGTPSTLRALFAEHPAAPAESLRLVDELRARDEALLDRLNTIIRTRNAVLSGFAPEYDPEATTADPTVLLKRFDLARGEVVSLLMNLTIQLWSATAIGPDGHETLVSDEVEDHVDFDEHQVVRITEAASAG